MKDNKFVKPKYKIGDVVVYRDLPEDDEGIFYTQSKIIEAVSSFYFDIENDVSEWQYKTERSEEDYIEEKDIICKLN